MKKTILFVDDEPNILQGLRRMLQPLRNEWEMTFVDSGEKALQLLSQSRFDTIVSDVRMPGMDGVKLFSEVMRRYPEMIRIFLSGQCDVETTLKSVKIAHQFLSKPCDPEALKTIITRASVLRELLNSDALKKLVTGMTSLPSVPSLFSELMEELKSPNARTSRLADIIAKDVAMTAKILQLVNSAFFGLPQRITDLQRAVAYLGFETIHTLALSLGIFSQFDAKRQKHISLQELWDHSLSTASLAQTIARTQTSDQKAGNDAFVAGLLHDIGRLVLAANCVDAFSQAVAMAREQRISLWKAEYEVLKVTHAEIGAYLLGLWGLPDAIVESTAFHHCPNNWPGETFSTVTAVHIADALERQKASPDTALPGAEFDLAYISRLGLADRLAEWKLQPEATLETGETQ